MNKTFMDVWRWRSIRFTVPHPALRATFSRREKVKGSAIADSRVGAHDATISSACSTSTDTRRDTPGSDIVTPTSNSAISMLILLCVM